MDYLTFHIGEEATEKIKRFLREGGSSTPAPTFSFMPAATGCELTIAAEGRPELALSLAHCLHVEEDPIAPADATRWRTPQYHGARPPADTGIGVKEIVFWIDGALIARLQEIGWATERARAFDYGFRPDAAGVTIWARPQAGGELLELTRDLD